MSLISTQGLPWNKEPGESKRLKRVVSAVTPIFLIVAVVITWIDLPEQEREELEKLPPQLARVIIEKKEPPKPKPKPKVEEKKPEPPKPKEEKVAKKPEPKKPKPKPKIVKKPKPKPQEVAKAREKAKQSGLLAMSSQLSELSALAETVKLDNPKTITAKPIARKSTDVLAARANTGRSAGIDESQFDTSSKEMTLAARKVSEVTQVEEIEEAIAQEEEVQAEKRVVGRTTEELKRTMDANKAAINRIYQRALRKRPSLQGIVTPELVIESNGAVSACSISQSTLGEPSLEDKICKRLMLVNFGDKAGVDPIKFKFPFDLLPG